MSLNYCILCIQVLFLCISILVQVSDQSWYGNAILSPESIFSRNALNWGQSRDPGTPCSRNSLGTRFQKARMKTNQVTYNLAFFTVPLPQLEEFGVSCLASTSFWKSPVCREMHVTKQMKLTCVLKWLMRSMNSLETSVFVCFLMEYKNKERNPQGC